MPANFKGHGRTLKFTVAGSPTTTNEPLLVGAKFGVVDVGKAVGAECILHTEGRFEIVAGTTVVASPGAAAYWDPTPGEVVTATTAGNFLIGYFSKPKANGEVVAEVFLENRALIAL